MLPKTMDCTLTAVPEVVGDVVELPVGHRARVHPRLEDGVPRARELLLRVLREGLAGLLLHHRLEARDDLVPGLLVEVQVGLGLALRLDRVQLVLELVLLDAQHHVAEHLDEAAVAVLGEAAVAGLGLEALHGPVVQAQVQDGVHHAGHGELGPAAHRHQQGILGVAELLAHEALELLQGGGALRVHLGRQRAAPLVVDVAGLRGDREARRHRKARVRHLREARALAAEQVLHVPVSVRLAAAEEVDVLSHAWPPSLEMSAMR